MSYITGVTSIVKGDRDEIFFDKSAFLLATNFSDAYFANDLNWKKIALHYRESSGTQRQVIILKDSNSRGWFAPSESSRTGEWAIEAIEVFDKQNDIARVERADMPTPGDFDIQVVRIIAPASGATIIDDSVELITNGTFDTDGNSWVNLSDGSGQMVWQGNQTLRITTPSAGNAARAYTSFNGVNGVTYKAKMDHTSNVSNYLFNVYENTPYDNKFVEVNAFGNGTSSFNFDAIGTENFLMIECNSSAVGGYIEIDNVSVRRVPDKLTLTPGEAAFWKVGYKCKIWNSTDSVYLSEDVYEITDITSNDIILDQQIIGDYEGKSLVIRFPSYADSSAEQQSLYEYVGSPGY